MKLILRICLIGISSVVLAGEVNWQDWLKQFYTCSNCQYELSAKNYYKRTPEESLIEKGLFIRKDSSFEYYSMGPTITIRNNSELLEVDHEEKQIRYFESYKSPSLQSVFLKMGDTLLNKLRVLDTKKISNGYYVKLSDPDSSFRLLELEFDKAGLLNKVRVELNEIKDWDLDENEEGKVVYWTEIPILEIQYSNYSIGQPVDMSAYSPGVFVQKTGTGMVTTSRFKEYKLDSFLSTVRVTDK